MTALAPSRRRPEVKKVAIVQSNYIPWKGYFDLIGSVDEFILYDDVQFTRRDWRNRNRIKTPDGSKWLTVPVRSKGRYEQSIRETEISEGDWRGTHQSALRNSYQRAPHYETVAGIMDAVYNEGHVRLHDLNRAFIDRICRLLEIPTVLRTSWDFQLIEGRSERLADLCVQAGADVYLSGPAARGYLDESVFRRLGVQVQWFGYDHYPVYPQLWGKFDHHVSIVDLLFNCGREAGKYMKYQVDAGS